MNTTIDGSVAIQGERGSNSELALLKVYPDAQAQVCESFEDVFAALSSGAVTYAFIPVENSIAGRVADIHHLLPRAEIAILGEHFAPIEHMLMAPRGATVATIKEVHSHVHALGQCRNFLGERGYKRIVHSDTAGAAKDIAQWNDQSKAAIASKLAAKLYDLEILAENIEDTNPNITRFLLLTSEKTTPLPSIDDKVITTLFFTLRSVPAALYKALGGFATNGINLTRLESYISPDTLAVAQFFVDVEGHPESTAMKHALDELRFFSESVKSLGTYSMDSFRSK